MNPSCNAPLDNLGSGDCLLKIGIIRRIMFVSQRKEDGTKNTISKTDAATLAAWQALFDKPNFSTSQLEKVVVSDKIFLAKSEQAEDTVFDEDGFYEKLEDGSYDITVQLDSLFPDKVKAYKALELKNLAIWLIDDSNEKIWGINNGANLDPIPLYNVSVENFNLKSIETISKEVIKMRLENGEDMNDLTFVEVADGETLDETDFYSLTDVENTISDPAVTGCQAVLATKRYDEALIGVVYGEITFTDQATPFAVISLASAGSLTEDPDGTYIINEAVLLTSGKTYDMKISKDGYDIDVGVVVVP